MKSNRRFTSEKTANSFAKKVNGEVRDLRSNPVRKSDFKVVYETNQNKSGYSQDAFDFDSDINMNGMRWHTAEDL